MSQYPSNSPNLITDNDTEKHYDYLQNDDKIDPNKRAELHKHAVEVENILDPKPTPSRKKTKKAYKIIEPNNEELPSSDSDNIDFNNNSIGSPNVSASNRPTFKSSFDKSARRPTERNFSARASVRPVPGMNYANARKPTDRRHPMTSAKQLTENRYNRTLDSRRPNTERKPNVNNVNLGNLAASFMGKSYPTANEKRAKGREMYHKLIDLEKKHGIELTRTFNVNDDPEEMEEEYMMHRKARDRNMQVKFYKQILINMSCGAEFVNDKYNPFDFELKDWSRQIATDVDDWEEILEEIYEKYQSKGGKMAPEMKLMMMIAMSGISYHVTNKLVQSGGLNGALKNNPGMINKFVGKFINGKSNPEVPPQSSANDVLARIKQRNLEKANQENNNTTTQTVPKDDKIAEMEKKFAQQQMELKLLQQQNEIAEAKIRRGNIADKSEKMELPDIINEASSLDDNPLEDIANMLSFDDIDTDKSIDLKDVIDVLEEATGDDFTETEEDKFKNAVLMSPSGSEIPGLTSDDIIDLTSKKTRKKKKNNSSTALSTAARGKRKDIIID
jgi:hypothetical protein